MQLLQSCILQSKGYLLQLKTDGLVAGKGGDTGTGEMGAYSPAPVLTKELQSLVMESIILPTVKGMSEEGCKFVGVLYAGLMIEKKSGLPKLIKYNVRFGDSECQVLMVQLESYLAQVLLAASKGELEGVSLNWSPGSAMVVVMATNGYPRSYGKGTVMQNLKEAELVAPFVKVFHAGTAVDADENFIATGGSCSWYFLDCCNILKVFVMVLLRVV